MKCFIKHMEAFVELRQKVRKAEEYTYTVTRPYVAKNISELFIDIEIKYIMEVLS